MSFIDRLLLIPRKENIKEFPTIEMYNSNHVISLIYLSNIQDHVKQFRLEAQNFLTKETIKFFRAHIYIFRRKRSKVPFTVFTSNFPTIPEYFQRFSVQRRRSFRSLNSQIRTHGSLVQTRFPRVPQPLLHGRFCFAGSVSRVNGRARVPRTRWDRAPCVIHFNVGAKARIAVSN